MNLRAPVQPRKLLTFLGLLFGALALVLTLALPVQGSAAAETATVLGVGFRGLSLCLNAAILLIYFGEITPSTRATLFRAPLTQAVVFGFALIALVYAFVLLGAPGDYTGSADIAARLAVYLCPALYLLWWVISPSHGVLQWNQLPLMLLPALAYLFYCLASALWAGQPQYPFLDTAFGSGAVATNAAIALAIFAITYAATIGLDQSLGRPRAAHPG